MWPWTKVTYEHRDINGVLRAVLAGRIVGDFLKSGYLDPTGDRLVCNENAKTVNDSITYYVWKGETFKKRA